MSSEEAIINATAAAMEYASKYGCTMELEIKSRFAKTVKLQVSPNGAAVKVGEQPTQVLPEALEQPPGELPPPDDGA